jgi:hypothetical protein
MDAISLLKQNHNEIRRLLGRLDQADNESTEYRQELAQTIRASLGAHIRMEEEIFYPCALATRSPQLGDLVQKAMDENRSIKLRLTQLRFLTPGHPRFDAFIRDLGTMALAHACAEEADFFPLFTEQVSASERQALGEKLEERKYQLQAGWSGTIHVLFRTLAIHRI